MCTFSLSLFRTCLFFSCMAWLFFFFFSVTDPFFFSFFFLSLVHPRNNWKNFISCWSCVALLYFIHKVFINLLVMLFDLLFYNVWSADQQKMSKRRRTSSVASRGTEDDPDDMVPEPKEAKRRKKLDPVSDLLINNKNWSLASLVNMLFK